MGFAIACSVFLTMPVEFICFFFGVVFCGWSQPISGQRGRPTYPDSVANLCLVISMVGFWFDSEEAACFGYYFFVVRACSVPLFSWCLHSVVVIERGGEVKEVPSG